MDFVLNPHTKAILLGRKMGKGEMENARLLCAATRCLFQPEESPDPDFCRDIEAKGFAICPRCEVKTYWAEGSEQSDTEQKTFMRCKACKKKIPKKYIKWTQKVRSRHRRNKHEYFHYECWENLFIDI